jgi:hypothetical protein
MASAHGQGTVRCGPPRWLPGTFGRVVRLHKLHQFVPTQIDIAEDLPEKSRPERFSGVDGDDGGAAVGVSEERVTPSGTKDLEACSLKCPDDILPRDPR